MAYSRYATELKDKENNIYGIMDEEARENKADAINVLLDTPSSVQTFPDGADNLPMALTVGIAPVQEGSGDPSPDNIRPISGWTGANVTRTGKNLLPCFGDGWVTGTTDTYYGAKTSDVVPTFPFEFLTSGESSYRNVPVYVYQCMPSTTYTITPPTGLKPIVSEYADYNGITSRNNALSRWATSSTAFSTAITQTTQATARYLVISFSAYGASSSVTVDENTQFQLEEGNSATPFVGFKKTYPITFPSEAGTVYGGTLTINKDGSGQLVVDRAIMNIADKTWSYNSSGKYFYFNIGNAVQPESTVIPGKLICDRYYATTVLDATSASGPNGAVALGKSASRIIIKNTACTTSEELVAEGGTVVYPLATPTTYTLTPGQVKTLLGVNNIFADTGDMLSVTYSADTKFYIDRKFAILQALILENISNT